MRSYTLILISSCIIKCNFGNFIEIDHALEPELVNQNQVFLNRKEKFIKFDTKDNNLEIELGISVPFIKVPLTTSKQISEVGNSKITINAPGLLVAGILMVTSFLVIPLLFTSTAATSDHGFGFQRKKKADMWSLVERVNAALSRSGIDSTSCVQKSICSLAKKSEGWGEGSIGQWINNFLKSWWLSRLISGTFIEDAMQVASNGSSCETVYSDCSIIDKGLRSFAKMAAGHIRHYNFNKVKPKTVKDEEEMQILLQQRSKECKNL